MLFREGKCVYHMNNANTIDKERAFPKLLMGYMCLQLSRIYFIFLTKIYFILYSYDNQYVKKGAPLCLLFTDQKYILLNHLKLSLFV